MSLPKRATVYFEPEITELSDSERQQRIVLFLTWSMMLLNWLWPRMRKIWLRSKSARMNERDLNQCEVLIRLAHEIGRYQTLRSYDF